MSHIALSVENVSKQYRLGQVGTGTLSHDLKRWWYRMRGQEDPYLKIGEANDRTQKGSSEYVWALRDVNFDIQQGEAVGIIGRNGAGKSTLLKLLSKVTKPTTGHIKVQGRIASLLEVGTGFHPEMTGRENIFLNGAILGMTRKEIKRKFDEIVDFAGVERYIDTPVKRYSSGMYVRLAFAVAAHLESEILIVDEVLAVGDAEFQKKCLGKMGDVSRGEGRTVLFVSHNMVAVKSLCSSGIVMENGTMKFQGNVDNALDIYNSERIAFTNSITFGQTKDFRNHQFELNRIDLLTGDMKEKAGSFHDGESIILMTDIGIFNKEDSYHLSFVVYNLSGEILFTIHNANNVSLQYGNNKIYCEIPKGFLNVGQFSLSVYLIKNKQEAVLFEHEIIQFKIDEQPKELGEWMGVEPGFVKTNFKWGRL